MTHPLLPQNTQQHVPINLAPPREEMAFDVVIVGAGLAGLAAAIRLKQNDPNISVVVLEKGAEVGAHILSGAVVDPVGIDHLLPDWRQEESHPFQTLVSDDQFLFLTQERAHRIPAIFMPKVLSNHGCYIVSLGHVCRWLAQKAEALGVEIYPGFAANELLYNEDGAICGVATGDMGLDKTGTPSANYMRGMALLGKYTLLAEGTRGFLSQQAINKFNLNHARSPQKYGLGLKELWEIRPQKHRLGLVQHTAGWPLDRHTGGGSFLYHLENNQVAVGFVVHLNYENPYLSPFEEFQRFKTHPSVRDLFIGGKRLSYGARVINEGGFQAVPQLSFRGGALIGCAAGFVNVARIKGSHNAVLSGIYAANHVATALAQGRAQDEITQIENEWRHSLIGRDLYPVRNAKPLWSKYGTPLGIGLAGFDLWWQKIFKFSCFGTLKHDKTDSACLKPAAKFQPITYPKPDGIVSFDRLSSVFLSNTNHEEDQPCHLKVHDITVQKRSEWGVFGGLSSYYCPAGVYEWIEESGALTYRINAQNCVHCKTCDIKDPNNNITWSSPQGGEGPLYTNM